MNAPDIPTEIKAEAARSLLERLWEKTALVRFFRYNAAAKHGVPIQDREFEVRGEKPVPDQPPPLPEVTPIPDRPVEPVPRPVTLAAPGSILDLRENRQGMSEAIKGAAIAAVVLGGMVLSGIAGYMMTKDPPQTPTPQATPWSPLQFIEDQGAHLP
jgi:hypothetical protein